MTNTPTIAARDPNAPAARSAIQANGAAVRRGRHKKPHLHNHKKHSRKPEELNLAKHTLKGH